jgi:hypothetical protein
MLLPTCCIVVNNVVTHIRKIGSWIQSYDRELQRQWCINLVYE